MELKEEKADRGIETIPLSEMETAQVSGKPRVSDSDDENEARGYWSSQIEYLLSVIGYSVGLGNVWRFPYICSRNGGGAFLIPFILCLVLCGLPLFFLEVAIGQFSGKSPVHVWSLCPLMKGMGVGMVLMAAFIPIYYVVICAWSLYYTIYSCRGVLPWTSCDNTWNTDNCVTSVKLLKQDIASNSTINNFTSALSLNQSLNHTNTVYNHSERENHTVLYTAAEEFWQHNALDISTGLEDIGTVRWELALCLFGSWVLCFLCIVKGVKSVGKAVYVTATLPYVILTILLVRGLALPGGPSGALFYITPDFTKILKAQVWIEASVQIFYSLGPLWGSLIAMASYNRFHANCYRNAVICTFVTEGTSLFAGLVVFSILGFMAHEADVPITEVVSSGPGLGFVIYPEALAQLPLPQLWSCIFFIMLILLALDTTFSLMEAVISAILDEFPFLLRWRVPVTAGYCFGSFLLGLILTTQGGMYIFQLIDWYWAAIAPFVFGVMECVTMAWIYGVKRFSEDIEMMLGKQVPVFFKITWCYITPILLMTTLIFTVSHYQPPTYGKYVYPGYVSAIGWCLASIPLVVTICVMGKIIYCKQGSLPKMENGESKDDTVPEVIPLSGRSRDPDLKEETKPRGQWTSEIEYLLSVIGFSVGLGNFWRFPYICSRNGGGAFLFPFLICLVLCGLPLFFLEVAIGQFSGKSPVHVWSLCPLMKGLGIGSLIISTIGPVYYSVICAWSLYYTIYSCRDVLPWTSCDNTWNTDSCVTNVRALKQDLNFTTDSSSIITDESSSQSYSSSNLSDRVNQTAAEEFWQHKALNITEGISHLGSIRWELALCLLGSWILIFLCVVKGVKSVGKAVYVTATLPYLILTILLVRGLTLPGGSTGALYYIVPDFSKLLNVQVWLEACLQMFYSLGTAQGGLIAMASYNKFHTNCVRNALIATFVSEGTSLFAGLVVFSILGFMATEAGVPVTEVVSSGPGLGFVTYPEALAQLPFPQLWSFIFFVMFILLAIDFLFAAVETVLSAILDEFPSLLKKRVPVVGIYCIISFLLSLVYTTQGGMFVFQITEWYSLSLFPILAGALECVVIGWVYGIQRFSRDIEMMIGKPLPFFFKITFCYITPVILTITFISTLSQYQPPVYSDYVYPGYALVIGWCIACAPMLPMIVMMALALYRGNGSLLQRLRQALTPEKSWGPSQSS